MTPAPTLIEALTALETLLADHRRRAAGCCDGTAEETARRDLEEALATLEAAAAAEPALAARHRARLERARGLGALSTRRVPTERLDGLYEAVRAGTRDPWARAGMSGAFLDAPQSLVRWRMLATAASLVLAVGIGLQLGRQDAASPRAPHPLSDPRDELLLRLDAPVATAGEAIQPVGLPGAQAAPGTWVSDEPARAAGTMVFTFPAGRGDDVRIFDAIDRRLRLRPAPPPARGDPEHN